MDYEIIDSAKGIDALIDEIYKRNHGDTHVSAVFSDGCIYIRNNSRRWCASTDHIAVLVLKSFPWIEVVRFVGGRWFTRTNLRNAGFEI